MEKTVLDMTTNVSSVINTRQQGLLSNNDFEIIELAFSCVLIHVFATIGMVFTSINIIILSRLNITSDSSNILLVSLSVADFLLCLTINISRLSCILTHALDTSTALKVDINFFQMLSAMSRFFYVISIMTSGAIAVERFLVVFFPFATVLVITPFRVKLVTGLIYLLNICLCFPVFFSFDSNLVYDRERRTLVTVSNPTDFFMKNKNVLNFLLNVVHNLGVLGLSMVSMICLTPAVAVKLWVVMSKRSKLTNKTCAIDVNVAKMLLAICAVSILFYGPLVCFNVVSYYLPEFSITTTSHEMFLLASDVSSTLCSSVNFVIYFTMSSKFRAIYSRFFNDTLLCRHLSH